uniref:Uncharacterized protein n=1 Tax=Candidatus Kentrum sp. FW TaxID=2126338 RepID=A0A450SHC6_9GAMM|nr:MAG: hypothetical protein BECKFW1821A_GA0114235_10378 [Candidatus Kentron sp. FW]
MITQPETSFQTVSELAHAITGQPVVIWIKDFQTEEVIARGQAGLGDDPVTMDAGIDMEARVVRQAMAGRRERMRWRRLSPVCSIWMEYWMGFVRRSGTNSVSIMWRCS